MLESAKSSKDSEEWVRCLIKWTTLRVALHGYETSVRFLREQPWPEDLLGSTVLNLYYARTLVTYAHSYSWEINKRERVETKGVVDLKAWTMDQIFAEAQRAYEEVWKHREQLGDLPAKHLSEYLEPNTYPEGIRPTLRDAVSYLRVEILADTQGWRPEQSNEVFRLDLKNLLSDAPAAKDGKVFDLADPGVHPLEKIAAILADLEQWHAKKARKEAAFEARRERLERLHASFTEDQDRARIKHDLEKRLGGVSGKPWWSMGMATLSTFVQAEDASDALIRARKIAIEGREAFPDSVGGKRCNHVVKSIEAPDYSLSGMSSDGPKKRSIEVTHKNLGALHFRAYAVDIVRQIETADDYRIYPGWKALQKMVESGRPAHTWSVELPATPDYRMHETFVTPPMTKSGLYVVMASARKDYAQDDNKILGLDVVVTDLVMVTRQEGGEVEVTVLDGPAGKPVPGAEVTLYKYDWRNKHKSVDSETTDAKGVVRFSRKSQDGSYFLFAKKGVEVAYDPNYLYFYRQQPAPDQHATLIFTDRSIYRPMQKLFWKALVYHGRYDRADYKIATNTSVTISLVDPNHQTVETKTVTTNAYGTASGEFTIPTGRILGQWHLQSSLNGTAYVRVEEYKRPTFESKFLDPASALRLNKPATLKGEARYYFGLPVTNGAVKWRVTREPVYPWWWGWYWWAESRPAAAKIQTVATGTAALKEDGTFTFTFTPEADERGAESKHLTFRYAVTADVTDEGGETRSASKSFRLGFVSVEAAVRMETGFLMEGQTGDLTVLRTNLDGVPKAGKGAWKLLATSGPKEALTPAEQPFPTLPGKEKKKEFATPGDSIRPRWNFSYTPEAVMRAWEDGGVKGSGEVSHNDKGEGKVAIPALSAGVYRLKYETQDEFGAKFEMSKEFVVGGRRANIALPSLLLVEESSVKVGGTARILALSGLRDQYMVLDVYREGKRVDRRQLESGRDSTLIEIPVTEKDRGGFGVTLSVLRDHQFMHSSQTVFVPWDDKELKVEFSTFRDKLRPGQKEKWTVKLSGPEGKDTAVAAAEVLSYLYDRSLDAFVPHSPPSPLSIWPHRASVVWARANLGTAHQEWIESRGFKPLPGWPDLHPDRLKFYEGYGIGGPGRRRYYKGGGAPEGAAMRKSMPMKAMARMDRDEAEMKAEEARPPAAPAAQAPMEAADKAVATSETKQKAGDGRDRREPEAPVQMRADFSETAYFLPHLITGADGTASIEFSVPDSVTSWNVWVHAVTKDLKSGSTTKEAKTVKDLMVRPYIPRFLREGDKAEIKVVVNNASDKEIKGHLAFDIIDPSTEKSVLESFGLRPEDTKKLPFTVPAGGGTNLGFSLATPAKVGLIAFKVTAVSGDVSDGELRPIPVLPGRMHLAQSRFVTLRGKGQRVMKFADLEKADDSTLINEQMVVTLDAQLFYSVLSALPYLVNYPYECTEQTLNRFVSTGILSSMYAKYPAIEKMAKEFSTRKTEFEQWDQPDPNRKMALEETPWLRMAKGGTHDYDDLVNVLDPRITRAQRDASLAKLRKAQTSSGGFPWFPGGPPSPWMTVYMLYGFSKALEFGVDVPKDMVQRAWSYVHRYYIDEIVRDMIRHDCCWETVTFINYVLSNYPDSSWTGGVFSDDERQKMLLFSFGKWKKHSPYLKGYLALTLKRMKREKDARLVWESVLDSAKEKEDQGTFWAPEDRGWLWYNDTIETHAFAIRTTMELMPEEPKLDGMVLWIFLNKKLNHWKSTRATAEVVYSLAHYLKKTDQLGVREDAAVTLNGETTRFVFEPDKYTGKKNQIVVPGEKVDPKRTSTITVEKDSKGYLFASATWHFSTEKLPEEDRGDYLAVSRQFFRRVNTGREFVLQPLKDGTALSPGDEVEVHISLRSKHQMEYVHLRDPRGAGFEPEGAVSRHKWELGIYWYEEYRDSGTNFFFERLPQGEYTFKYRIRAATAGTFKVAPATVQPMYAPEFNAYSAGAVVKISSSEEKAK
ncbi:MAG: hypothetical protein HY897_24640 [Deltaproteobacteria bacterium]|nr:hypothetical protein [Deltaproteobacteria bacterium]